MHNNETDNFFVSFLKKILPTFESGKQTAEQETETLVAEGETEAEKDILRQICDEIDATNEAMTEWEQAGKPEPGKWLADEVKKMAEEADPKMSEADKAAIPGLVGQLLDEEIRQESRTIAETIAGEPLSDKEVEQIKHEEEEL